MSLDLRIIWLFYRFLAGYMCQRPIFAVDAFHLNCMTESLGFLQYWHENGVGIDQNLVIDLKTSVEAMINLSTSYPGQGCVFVQFLSWPRVTWEFRNKKFGLRPKHFGSQDDEERVFSHARRTQCGNDRRLFAEITKNKISKLVHSLFMTKPNLKRRREQVKRRREQVKRRRGRGWFKKKKGGAFW